jgi:signal transduction histidine kinase
MISRNIPLRFKLYFVIGIMTFLISLELFTLWFTMHSLSSVRAYVEAEGLWSKSQKDATYHLYKYSVEKDPHDYFLFNEFLKVQGGDKKARLELLSENPDYQIAFKGFEEGRVNKSDIDGMIKLFNRFHKIYYIDRAIFFWTRGDSLISELRATGKNLNSLILQNKLDPGLEEQIRARIDLLNTQLTIQEDNFSSVLGDGSRWLEDLVLKILLGTALFVEISGLLISFSISRGISHSIKEINQKNSELEEKFNDLRTKDEALGVLANELNEAQKISHIGSFKINLQTGKSQVSEEFFNIIEHSPTKDRTIDFQYYKSLVHPEDIKQFEASLSTAKEKKDFYFNQYRLVLPSGKIRYVFAKGKIESDETGSPVLYQGTLQDITELISIQINLKKINDELNKSQVELEQFAYVASHDLKEPLRMITSYTQLLIRLVKDNEKAKEYAAFIVEGSQRMHAIITNLLEFSSINKNAVHYTKVDLNDLLSGLLKKMNVLIERKKAEVNVGKLPTIMGDTKQLSQVFENLLDNAIKFGKKDESPVIDISCEEQEHFFLFSVKDNGIGINPEYKDKIFFLFQRLGDRKEYPGSGVGLSISKKIIELQGGKIWMNSEPGKGSNFHFTLPKAK